MPDTLDLSNGDANPANQQAVDRWVQQAQQKLAAGGTLQPNEIPTGYVVDGNQLVHKSQWDQWGKGAAIGMGLGMAGGFGAGALNSLGAAPTLEQMMNSAASVAGSSSTVGGVGASAGGAAGVSAGAGGASSAFGLPDWLKAARDVGSALSDVSKGRAEGRVAEGRANQEQNRAAVDLYNSELAAPRTIARNAVKGDILSNAHDVNIDAPSTIPVPKISGGLHPDMFSPETRATGVGLRSNALASAANLKPAMAPVLPDLPQAGTLDSILNTGSSIANIASKVPWKPIMRMF